MSRYANKHAKNTIIDFQGNDPQTVSDHAKLMKALYEESNAWDDVLQRECQETVKLYWKELFDQPFVDRKQRLSINGSSCPTERRFTRQTDRC